MGRPKKKAETLPEPEDVSQEGPDDDERFLEPEESVALARQENGQPSVNKAAAVREAMAQGLDDLDAIAAYIKQHHGLEMARPQLSAYASQNRARLRKAEGGDVQPRQRRSSTAQPQQMMIPFGFAEDIKEIRRLMEVAGGADNFRELIGSIGPLVEKYRLDGLTALVEAIG